MRTNCNMMTRQTGNPVWLCVCLLLIVGLMGGFGPQTAQAQGKPFMLPVALPPGPSTWLLGQPYGNTAGAFLRGQDWYRAGQRLHFGLDLSMPCGTPLVAIGDGEVVAVDDLSFGSAPHNLLIRHDAGYVSLYGHLLERPSLVNGQRVTRGQEVARSGDPDITCDSRPHLHLEIRSLDYRTAYNPVDVIDAAWQTLALVGPFRYPLFQQDLNNARRWLTQDDQPTVAFGGAALNAYTATFPAPEAYAAPPTAPNGTQNAGSLPAGWTLRRLAFDGCCANAEWHPSAGNLLYLTDGAPGQAAAVFEWDVTGTAPTGVVLPAPLPLRSPDGSYTTAMRDGRALIRRAADGAEWPVETRGAVPATSPANDRLMWLEASGVALPGETAPSVTLWVSGIDGANPSQIAAAAGLNAMWLDDGRLLLSQRTQALTSLYVHDLASGQTSPLGAFNWLRSLSAAPGGGRLVFMIVYQDDPSVSGIYTMDTQPGAAAQRLPWFGGWRWRDADELYSVPLDTEAARAAGSHQLRHYDLTTGIDSALTDPAAQPFVIAEGDWSVSADGARIAFWNALDRTVWLLEPQA